jgi:hypothetical protein
VLVFENKKNFLGDESAKQHATRAMMTSISPSAPTGRRPLQQTNTIEFENRKMFFENKNFSFVLGSA